MTRVSPGLAPPFLALDLGTSLGWAVSERDRVTASGRLDLSQRPGAHPGARYLLLARWLQRQGWPADMIVAVEDVQSHIVRSKTGTKHFATTAAHVYGGLRGVAEAWACATERPVLPVGVGTWKAGIGCRGGSHATKDEVMRCVRLLGYAPQAQDEADAIGIALHAPRAWLAQRLGTAPASAAKKPTRSPAARRRK